MWEIRPNADRQAVEALIRCVAERLGIPVPDMSGDLVTLPPHTGPVVGALEACNPEWTSIGLVPPPCD